MSINIEDEIKAAKSNAEKADANVKKAQDVLDNFMNGRTIVQLTDKEKEDRKELAKALSDEKNALIAKEGILKTLYEKLPTSVNTGLLFILLFFISFIIFLTLINFFMKLSNL